MSVTTAARPDVVDEGRGRQRRIGAGLLAAAGVYLVGIAGMVTVGASRPPARLLDGLAEFEQGLTLYRLGFAGASLLAPAFVALLLLLVVASGVPANSARRWVGTALLAAYVPLATVAYTSQYAILPRLVERAPDTAALWYFHDVDSIPYGLDLAGYVLLGLAAVALASALADRGRLYGAIAWWLVAMAVTSIMAFGLHVAGVGAVGGIVSLVSAGCSLPVVALASVEGRRLRR